MLKMGCARREITPSPGTQIAGDGSGLPRPAEVVLDPIYARAVVLACGQARVAMLSLDVLIVTEEWTARIRAAAGELGFSPEAVMVHATQDHSAPTLGHIMFDPDFMPDLPMEQELQFIDGDYDTFKEKPSFESSFTYAIENRPDLKSLEYPQPNLLLGIPP